MQRFAGAYACRSAIDAARISRTLADISGLRRRRLFAMLFSGVGIEHMTNLGTRPRSERPRERLLEAGAELLSDRELLAVLLGSGLPGRDAMTLSRSLLDEWGNLHTMMRQGARGLIRAKGLGPARTARLLGALELGRRCIEGPTERRRTLKRPQDAARCFKARLADLSHEVFSCLFLDARHRIICYEPLFRGTVDGATVYPREVLKRALYHEATAVILGHNHPSGNCEPSESDRTITTKLAEALALVDIRLLDHLVVSRNGHVSLAERGWV